MKKMQKKRHKMQKLLKKLTHTEKEKLQKGKGKQKF